MKRSSPLTAGARALWVMLGFVALAKPALVSAAPAAPAALRSNPNHLPIEAWVVSDGAAGETCTGACLQRVLAQVKRAKGVKAASVEGDSIRLTVSRDFKAAAAIRKIEGMRVEMRVPYQGIEMQFAPAGQFPPTLYLSGERLVVEASEKLRKAIDERVKFTLPERLKCVGKLTGPAANEAILVRFETERTPPAAVVPFLTEADLDGDRRPDLYLRLAGLPDLVVFERGGTLRAVAVDEPFSVDEIPRCEQSPARYLRPVAKQKVRCAGVTPPHAGDAVERVEPDGTRELVVWHPEKGFAKCEPLGEGGLPREPKKKRGTSGPEILEPGE